MAGRGYRTWCPEQVQHVIPGSGADTCCVVLASKESVLQQISLSGRAGSAVTGIAQSHMADPEWYAGAAPYGGINEISAGECRPAGVPENAADLFYGGRFPGIVLFSCIAVVTSIQPLPFPGAYYLFVILLFLYLRAKDYYALG